MRDEDCQSTRKSVDSNKTLARRVKTPSGNTPAASVNKIKRIFENNSTREEKGRASDLPGRTYTTSPTLSVKEKHPSVNKLSQPELLKVRSSKVVKTNRSRRRTIQTRSQFRVKTCELEYKNSSSEVENDSEGFFTPPNTPQRSIQPLISCQFKKMQKEGDDCKQTQVKTQDEREKREEGENSQDETVFNAASFEDAVALNNQVKERSLNLMETSGEEEIQGDMQTQFESFEMKMMHQCFRRLEEKVDKLTREVTTGVSAKINTLEA